MSKINEVSELDDIPIYPNKERELKEEATCKKFLQVQSKGTNMGCKNRRMHDEIQL